MPHTPQPWRVIAHRIRASQVHTFDTYDAARTAWQQLKGHPRASRIELRDPQGRSVMDTHWHEWMTDQPEGDGLDQAEPGLYTFNEATGRYDLRRLSTHPAPPQPLASAEDIEAACAVLLPLAERSVNARMVNRGVVSFLRFLPAIVRSSQPEQRT